MPPVAQGHKATSHLGLACIEESRVVVCVCLQWDTNGKWFKAISTTMCACVFIYSSSTTGAKLTLCRLTHFPHCTSLLISNNSRSFGVGGDCNAQHPINKQKHKQLTNDHKLEVIGRQSASRRWHKWEVRFEVGCEFWWLALIIVINQYIYTA